jgi:hypothetical protein
VADEEPKSLPIAVVKWLSGQPFNNVLLLAILVALGWGTRYAVTVAVPSHLKQIQDGYKEVISEVHGKHEVERSHLHEERQRILETYDKWFDRIERRDAANTANAKFNTSPNYNVKPELNN